MTFFQIVSILLSLTFILYGVQCLVSPKMKLEFKRFGLSQNQRILTGILQLLGASGLTLGLLIPLIGIIASAGLGILMLLGFNVRLKIKDNLYSTLPSFIFMIVNFIVCYCFIKGISLTIN